MGQAASSPVVTIDWTRVSRELCGCGLPPPPEPPLEGAPAATAVEPAARMTVRPASTPPRIAAQLSPEQRELPCPPSLSPEQRVLPRPKHVKPVPCKVLSDIVFEPDAAEALMAGRKTQLWRSLKVEPYLSSLQAGMVVRATTCAKTIGLLRIEYVVVKDSVLGCTFSVLSSVTAPPPSKRGSPEATAELARLTSALSKQEVALARTVYPSSAASASWPRATSGSDGSIDTLASRHNTAAAVAAAAAAHAAAAASGAGIKGWPSERMAGGGSSVTPSLPTPSLPAPPTRPAPAADAPPRRLPPVFGRFPSRPSALSAPIPPEREPRDGLMRISVPQPNRHEAPPPQPIAASVF